MAASRRPRRTNRPRSASERTNKITTVPAPAAAEPITENAPLPAPSSPEAKAVRKSTIPKSPKVPGQTVIAAIQSLLHVDKQEQLLDSGVEIISQHLLKQLDTCSSSNPTERVKTVRTQLRNCIETGKLLPQTKSFLTDRIDRYFETLEEQLTQKEEIPVSLELRKLSRTIAIEIRQTLSQCLRKLDVDNINHMSTYIYINLPKPTPDNLKLPGIDDIFRDHFREFFEENIKKADLEIILEKMIHIYPHLFGDRKKITVTNEIFSLLAGVTWEVIKEGLGN